MTPAAERLKSWREKPAKMVWEEFKVQPDKWQEKALDAFASNDPAKRRISMQACAGPGKSAVEAWIGLNFLGCYGRPGQHPKGAAVSITSDNLKDNLWVEFKKWQERSNYFKTAFTWTHERIFANDHKDTWFLSARSWSKTADAEEQGRTLSGLHSEFVLILMDESGEIPMAVGKTGEQALGNCEFGKIVQAGNPTSKEGMLFFAHQNPQLWYVICITGDPEDPDRSPRVDINWAREQIATYGRDNPWVMSLILGQFPPTSINTLLSIEEVQAAMARILQPADFDWAQKRLGIDVARGGIDATSIVPRQGLMSAMPVRMHTNRGNDVAARAVLAKSRWDWEMSFVDDTGGYGGSVIDSMIQYGLSPVPVNFAGKADDPRYFNKRSEMWFRMADWVKRGGMLPNYQSYVRQLSTPTYTFQLGKFRLEEKDQIKKRLGFSPDDADALALTFAIAEMPGAQSPEGQAAARASSMKSDYDPIAAYKKEIGIAE